MEISDAERPRLKGVLQAAVEEITLDPHSLDCRIHYRIAADRTLEMASPRGGDRWPVFVEYQKHTPKVATTFGCKVS